MSNIPYSPSLVLGSVVHPEVMNNLLEMSAIQAPIDAAHEALNSYIALKRSLSMTSQELINMNIAPTDLTEKMKRVDDQIDEAATAYATIRMEQETRMQPLRAKVQMVNLNIESPLDYNRTLLKGMDLASESLKFDAQYFAFEDNAQSARNTVNNIKSYVGISTKQLGANVSFDIATAAAAQVANQLETHKIAGTLVMTATCTHKKAQVFAPLALDVDKAVRVWNSLFPADEDKIRIDPETIQKIAEQEGTKDEKAFHIISGATYGSSFVGMVHVLRSESTSTGQSMSSASGSMQLQAQVELGSWFADMKGGFGIDGTMANDLKSLLSTQEINAHVTLITTGTISGIKGNQLKIGVKKLLDTDPAKTMAALATMASATASEKETMGKSAAAARTKGKMMAMNSASIKSAITGLADVDDGSVKVMDVNSLMTAFTTYVAAVKEGKCLGVPINYYCKPITRTQLAQMWVAKYYPGKYLAIAGDDIPPVPPADKTGTDAGATAGQTAQAKPKQ